MGKHQVKLDFTQRVVMINGHQYVVRMAKETDISSIVEIEQAIYGQAPWSYAAFQLELQRPNDRLYLVIESDKQLIGFIGLAVDWYHLDLHVTNIGVTPGYQRKHIGTYLIKTAINVGRFLKLRSMSLEVRVHNLGARKLYERLGFRERRLKRHYYLDNQEDAVDMKLNLLMKKEN